MSFDAHEEKIRKIFSGDAQFTIPRNQRKYVWEEKQWKELVGDIDYIKKRKVNSSEDISHFLGSFVLQENVSIYEIIDGQQRITTLFIMLSAICLLFNEMECQEEHGITRQYLSGNIGLKSQYMRLDNKNIPNIAIIMAQACTYRDNLKENELLDRALIKKESEGNMGQGGSAGGSWSHGVPALSGILCAAAPGLPRQMAEAYGETLLALPLLRTAFPLLRPGW